MTTVDDTKTNETPMNNNIPGTKSVTRKAAASHKKGKSGNATVAPKAGQPNPFEVRVDDSGTVMPSFWRFGE